jgi:hypothetical protein
MLLKKLLLPLAAIASGVTAERVISENTVTSAAIDLSIGDITMSQMCIGPSGIISTLSSLGH